MAKPVSKNTVASTMAGAMAFKLGIMDSARTTGKHKEMTCVWEKPG